MKTQGSLALLAALAALVGASGCGHHNTPNTPAAADAAAPSIHKPEPAFIAPDQLEKAKVNETGVVPILEYHDIGPTENPKKYMRSVENFRKDLQRLYDEGYRPVLLSHFLDNRIDAPLGTTPVIFTFDDAKESQFRYLPDGTLDPNCALGIMKDFAAAHPDFPVRATFFVLPDVGFVQRGMAAKKMQAILAMGCELGNHTVTHHSLRAMSDAEVQQELGLAVAKILKLAPNAKIDTIALPYGISPKNKDLLASGSYQGQAYANRAVLLVGANPALPPTAPKFNPMRLPRIQASDIPSASTVWLDHLKEYPGERYVSDGDPATVTAPKSKAAKVDQSKLNGATLRLY
ncbi:MAG TPA: polysaccharide deacetylase family protein [Chthonomonadaceae bacterium]|nr:polysaccharide deacetylase family protein [Chthonomonadaceae bacterium]